MLSFALLGGIFIALLMNQGLFCLVSILVTVKVIFATPVIVVDKKQNGYLWGNLIALMTNIVQRGGIRVQTPKDIERKIDRSIHSW